MSHPTHHIHKRIRKHEKLEKYPHPEKFKRFFDKLIYIASIATPIITLPQVFTIWIEREVEGVSVITWSSFMTISLVFAIYGFLHKELPLIIMYSSQFVLQVLIVFGAIIFTN